MSAIVPPEKRRKPGPAKGTRPAGRKLGTKNKATVARELQAAQQILQAQSKDHESALAVLSRLLADLDRFKQLAEGAASYHRPPTAEELAAAQEAEDAIAEQEGREARTVSAGDWGLFGQWFDRTVSTAQAAVVVAKELAKYQAPQIKAVDAILPPTVPMMKLASDHASEPDDSSSRTARAQQTYLRLVKGDSDAA